MGCFGKCGSGEYMGRTLQQVCTVGNLGRTCTYQNTTSSHSVLLGSALVGVTWCWWLISNVVRRESVGPSLTCCWRGDHGRWLNVSPHLLYVFLDVLVEGLKDVSLNENKPHKSCSDSVIDSQQSDSTVTFLVPNQIIFSQNKFSCFSFFICSHLRWSRPVGTLRGLIHHRTAHMRTVFKTLCLSANSFQTLIDSDHIARAIQPCAVASLSSHAWPPRCFICLHFCPWLSMSLTRSPSLIF